MNLRKHVYFITVSDVQRVAQETLGRALSQKELTRITEKILDNIQWYDPIEEAILTETKNQSP